MDTSHLECLQSSHLRISVLRLYQVRQGEKDAAPRVCSRHVLQRPEQAPALKRVSPVLAQSLGSLAPQMGQ